MDGNEKEDKTDEEINWLKFCTAIATVTVGLQDYVQTKMQKLWQEVCTKCKDYICQGECRRGVYCANCIKWKAEIQTHYKPKRHPTINWGVIDHTKWRTDPQEMMKMFVYVKANDLKTTELCLDLTFILSLFENCDIFNIPPNDIEKLREVRNMEFAHNTTGTLLECKLSKYLRYMSCIFYHENIRQTAIGKKAFEKLIKLQEGKLNVKLCENYNDDFTLKDEFEKMISQSLESLKKIKGDQNDIKQVLHRIERALPKSEESCWSLFIKVILGIALIEIVLVVSVLWYCGIIQWTWTWSKRFGMVESKFGLDDDCFQLKNSPFVSTVFPYDKYLQNHRKFHREWLRIRIEDRLWTDNQGVLLSAETGFGTTAFIASLLCSKQSSNSSKIRNHTIVFHRCMHESSTTIRPDEFIFNFATGLANVFPVYQEYIENNKEIRDWIGEKCSYEAFVCLDIVILKPLDLLSLEPDYDVIIILDALEKCKKPMDSNTGIVELLERRISEFKPYIKFLITTSPITTSLNHLLSKIDVQLDSKEHLDDMRRLIKLEVGQRRKSFKNLLAEFKNDNSRMIERIIKVSRGHFYFLRNWFKLKTLTLEGLESQNVFYSNIFIQEFGQFAEHFKETKTLLEIISAANDFISESDLINVAQTPQEQKHVNFRTIIYGKMRQFIRISDGTISIQWSYRDWIRSSKNNELFAISVENGHALIVHHYLEKYPLEPISLADAVYLIEHVAKSHKEGLEVTFLFRIRKDLKQYTYDGNFLSDLLSNVPLMLDCFECVDLVFKLFSAEDRVVEDKNMYQGIRDTGTAGKTESMRYFIDAFYKRKFPNMKSAAKNWKANSSFIQEFVCPLLEIFIEHLDSKYYKALDFEIFPKVSLANVYNLIMSSINCNKNCIDELLGKGVQDRCLRCKEFNVLDSRTNPCIVPPSSVILENTNHIQQFLIDMCPYVCNSERLTFKTALHTSIAAGNSEIARKLLTKYSRRKKKDYVNCRSNGGWTPLLTSVRYDNVEAFKLLHENEANALSTCQYRESGICNVCPVKASFEHLILMYGSENILNYALNEKRDLVDDWNVQNQFNKATPIFYGICSSLSKNIFNFLPVETIDVSARTDNGISPFHLACLCRNCEALEYLKSKTGRIPDYFDNEGLGMFHYLFLERKQNDERISSSACSLTVMANTLGVNKPSFYHLDMHGRSFVHLAVLNGRFEDLHKIFLTNTSAIFELLMVKNSEGLTPLDTVFEVMKDDPNSFMKDERNYFDYRMTAFTLISNIQFYVGISSKTFPKFMDVGKYGSKIYMLLYLALRGNQQSLCSAS